MQLIFASANPGKINEVHQILGNTYLIKSLKEFDISEEIPETGSTFRENAYLKANFVYQKTKQNVFADDSGLVIDALNGEPGVYSAYYGGTARNDQKNIQLVLLKLNEEPNRKAHFVCSICLIFKHQIYYFDGYLYGSIAHCPKGERGFGYDPIFIPHNFHLTLAEISSEIKNSISHRYQAIAKMKGFLSKCKQ